MGLESAHALSRAQPQAAQPYRRGCTVLCFRLRTQHERCGLSQAMHRFMLVLKFSCTQSQAPPALLLRTRALASGAAGLIHDARLGPRQPGRWAVSLWRRRISPMLQQQLPQVRGAATAAAAPPPPTAGGAVFGPRGARQSRPPARPPTCSRRRRGGRRPGVLARGDMGPSSASVPSISAGRGPRGSYQRRARLPAAGHVRAGEHAAHDPRVSAGAIAKSAVGRGRGVAGGRGAAVPPPAGALRCDRPRLGAARRRLLPLRCAVN